MIDSPPSDNTPAAPSPEDKPGDATATAAPSFGSELSVFVQRIEALARTLPLMMAVVQLTEREATKRLNGFLEKKCTPTHDGDGKAASYTIPTDHHLEYERLKKRLNTARQARSELPRSYLISMVSQFDAFLGRLIRTMYFVKPELLNASERNISFQQLMVLGSVNAARELLLEKEVESVLRESHSEHFRWLEQKLGIPLRKDLDAWPAFVEVTERRNLFVHTGGTVSTQYLKVCEEHGVAFSQPFFKSTPKQADELGVSPQYFMHAYRILFEMGFKLAHVTWRKLQPQDREEADGNLIDITFDVLSEGDYELARTLLDFSTLTIKKFSKEDRRRRLVINRAQAYKWSGMKDEAKNILEAEDWSASGDHFQLAVAVLSEDYGEAAKLMRALGVNKQFTKVDYHTWPVFREFRERTEFFEAYRDVFGEDYVRAAEQDPEVDLLDLMPPK